jgi:integrase
MKGSIQKRGKASWRLKFDLPLGPDGKRRTQFVTVRGGKKIAQAKLAELLASLGKGIYVSPSRTSVADHVRARIDQWSTSGVIGAKTTKRYGVLLEKQITPHLGDTALQRLSTNDIEKWHAKLKAAGLAPGTIKAAHKVMVKALDDAVRHDQLARNVCALQRVPKAATEEVAIITADQIEQVVSKLKGVAIYPRAMLALFCGLRAGEILGLRWRSLDLDKRLLHVREATEEVMGQPVTIKEPKTAAGKRTLTVPDVAIEALRDHRRQQLEQRMALGLGKMPDDTLVFAAMNGGPAGTANLSKQWRGTVKALGLPDVNFHSLRHSHASMLIDAKLDLATISKRLGHANPAVTLRTYAHRFKTDDAAAADAINAALGANPVPKSG